MKSIDLNCDMGEVPQAIADGTQEALLRCVTSANIACGGHAGDATTMRTTIEQAQRAGVAIGAHPGYPDRENFGRLEMTISAAEVADSVYQQLRALAEIAKSYRAQIIHVKPHGALYNQAVKNRELANAIAAGVAKWSRKVVMVGLAGSPMLEVFHEAGFAVAAEAFADRRYEPDGTLRSRKLDNALLHDPEQAARQALSVVEKGKVTASDGSQITLSPQTICIHGDTPGAKEIAAEVARVLTGSGVRISSLRSGHSG